MSEARIPVVPVPPEFTGNRWSILRRTSFATAAAGFVGSLIACILLLVFPPAIFSLALYPLIYVGLGSIALILIGSLLHLCDTIFRSNSHALPQPKLEQELPQNKSDIIIEHLKANPALLEHLCPENDMDLLKPFFTSWGQFEKLMSLLAPLDKNPEGNRANALLVSFLLYEEKLPNDKLALQKNYKNTLLYSFLNNGLFLQLLQRLPEKKQFFTCLMEKVASLNLLDDVIKRHGYVEGIEQILKHLTGLTRGEVFRILTWDPCFKNVFKTIEDLCSFAKWLEQEGMITDLRHLKAVISYQRFWDFLVPDWHPFNGKSEWFIKDLQNLKFLGSNDIVKKLFLNEKGDSVDYAKIFPHILANFQQQSVSFSLVTPLSEILPEYKLLFDILKRLECTNFSQEACDTSKDALKQLSLSGDKMGIEIYRLTVKILLAAVKYEPVVKRNGVGLELFKMHLERLQAGIDKVVNRPRQLAPGTSFFGEIELEAPKDEGNVNIVLGK